jgi:hypothetical protein
MPQAPAIATARPGLVQPATRPASGKPIAWIVRSPAELTAIVRANRCRGAASRTRASSPSEYMLHMPDAASRGMLAIGDGPAAKAR